MVPLLGAIAGCHSRVLDQFWGSGRGHCWVPFAGCHVLDPFWGSGRGAIAGCHCRVPFQCAMVVDVVPLLGHSHCNPIVMCYGGRRG